MEFTGIALHTGEETAVRVMPASADTGYRFRRMDIPGAPEVEANVHNIHDTLLATSLGFNGASVKTVEHLLAALAGMGVDNALIEVRGDEVPIMDGSAAPFVRGLEMVGISEQAAPKRLLRILEPIEAVDEQGSAILTPSDMFRINFIIEFDSAVVGRQEIDYSYTPESFAADIAFARTFGFLKDVEYLQEKGLARGGSMENAVVVGDDGVANPEGLRSPDEFVRHKVLDTIGDLSLLGIPILGAYKGHKAGHRINRMLMQEVMNKPDNWELVCLEETREDEIIIRPIGDSDIPAFSAAL
jgi:UDP-3-O-[3-hydroxymyristoyl] N-acetylglucosamine deacetylase